MKGKDKAARGQAEALLAVPNLVDSELVDIYLLPSRKRIHASLNFVNRPKETVGNSVKPEEGRTGLIMGLHLGFDLENRLNCVMGFEDGRVEVWRCDVDPRTESSSASTGPDESPITLIKCEELWRRQWDGRMSTGPALWKKVYEAKGHNEAGKLIPAS